MLAALLALPLAAAGALPTFQPRDTPFAELFKRAGAVPDPNSGDFASHYPSNWKTPNATDVPQAWKDKLASIKLPPNNPVATTSKSNGGSAYDGIDKGGNNPDICSFTWGCIADSDYFEAPNGTWLLNFDDGPTEASPRLYDFLRNNQIEKNATHFMIGSNIQSWPKTMQEAFNQGGHIAVHTWSHPMMTTMTNEQVLGELGWTMQIISDLTGGRLPAFWRPPYGDVDNRVRTIAKEVFGMETVVWNKDTNDWKIGSGSTVDSVDEVMRGFITGPKGPGIVPLEHELNNDTVQVFLNSYPLMKENGWTVSTAPDAYGLEWYQNAKGNEGAVVSAMSVGEVQPDLNKNASWANPSSASPSSSAGNDTGKAINATGTGADSANKSPSTQQGNKNNSAARLGVSATLLLPAIALIL
jgi:peptidoglycan/xylan/chitin deacetylase (PgdA/CDA1 family)